jgi:hypothetical protein
MVQVKQCILDPTQIPALFGTPIVGLPAPPVGFINNILGVTHNMKFATAPYSGGSVIIYGANNGTSVFTDSGVLAASSDYNLPSYKTTSGHQTVFSTTEDFMITTDSAATGGDSKISAYIIFEQVQIGV